jgi:AraC-like DNA-binding protein
MEGLMLEFLACWLDGQSKSGSGQSPRLKPDEIDRIWNAKEILLKDMCNPPSLMSLASSVGLTHTRLNLGFKSVFGGTVYEYLRNQRLEKARLLVVEGAKNMTEIAYETGFASGSHFAYAFRKRFGVSPSRY